jgi:hypothetical protein
MNERIQKMVQAHLLHERFTRYGESVVEDFYELYPEDLDQIIKAIVQECRNVCVRQSIYYAGQGKMLESGAAGACGHLIDIALGVES